MAVQTANVAAVDGAWTLVFSGAGTVRAHTSAPGEYAVSNTLPTNTYKGHPWLPGEKLDLKLPATYNLYGKIFADPKRPNNTGIFIATPAQ